MKWSILFSFLMFCLVRNSEEGALRCSSGNDDPSCTTEREENDPPLEVAERGQDAECLAGSEWESNCHFCRCSDSGVAECLKQTSCDSSLLGEPIQCKPNTTFVRDCNTCTCLDNGLGLCTLDVCSKSTKSTISRKSEMKSGRECALGTTWENECKQCHCNSEGIAVCTDLPCDNKQNNLEPEPETRENGVSLSNYLNTNQADSGLHKLLKRSTCKPNQEFASGCNSCKCAPNGQTYTCTEDECVDSEVEVFMKTEGVDHIERHSVCKPQDTFYIGCNTCNCNDFGTDYSCTNKPCPLPEDVEVFHELNEMKPIVPLHSIDKWERARKL